MTISIVNTATGLVSSSPFSSAIIEARQRFGYSIEQLAVTCGLTTDEISSLESGDDSDPLRFRRVAAALQIPVPAII